MRGSTRRRGNRWSYYFASTDPATGRRHQITKSGFPTKKAAEEALRVALTKSNSVPVQAATAPLSDVYEAWLELRQTSVSPAMATLEAHALAGWWVPHLGKVNLGKITTEQIQHIIVTEMADLAPATIKSYLSALNRFFGWAVKAGYASANPVTDVVRPRALQRDLSIISPELMREVLAAFKDDLIFVPVAIAALTGMRRGEVLGLRWGDVDFETGAISINRTWGKHGEQPPKTARSRRRIAIGPGVVALLQNELDWQAKVRAELGVEWNPDGWVCVTRDGTPRDPDNVSHWFTKRIAAAGLPKMRFHDLRHAHATQLLREGEHPRIVSERLGHSSISVTLDIYSHVLPDMQQSAADKADAWLD